jgi:glycosyltransferase involved in cell wall biosynthesis
MSAGLPIVALAGPSIVDLLQDGINGRLVFRRSPHIFAAQAAGILNNPDKAASLGLQAQKDARKQFDNSISWSKLLDVYTVVAGKS